VHEDTLTHQRVRLVLVILDSAVAVLAYAAAFLARVWVPLPFTTSLLPAEKTLGLSYALLLALLTQVPLLYLFGLYDRESLRRGVSTLPSIAAALGTQLLLIATWYFFRGQLLFPRTVLVLFTLVNVAAIEVLRLWARHHLAKFSRTTRLLLVGSTPDVEEFQAILRQADPDGRALSVAATIDPSDEAAGAINASTAGGVDAIILVTTESWKDRFLDQTLRAAEGAARPRLAVVPTLYDLLVGRLSSLSIEDTPLIEVAKNPRRDLPFLVKGVFDYALATLLLIVAAPIYLAATLAIKVTSRGPVLFRQSRVGRDGQEFIIYKLRTMRADAESSSGPVMASPRDDRVTAVGRLLRITRLDEVPQLWNVLNGTMSIVGPRPERPEFARRFALEIPGYRERWAVKPGLTGLAQVRGRYHTSPTYKLKYDLAYIYNYSLTLDFRIVIETLKLSIGRRGL